MYFYGKVAETLLNCRKAINCRINCRRLVGVLLDISKSLFLKTHGEPNSFTTPYTPEFYSIFFSFLFSFFSIFILFSFFLPGGSIENKFAFAIMNRLRRPNKSKTRKNKRKNSTKYTTEERRVDAAE